MHSAPLRWATPALAALFLAQPAIAQDADNATLPGEPYPPDYRAIEQCAADRAAPRLPEAWAATALLTPFDDAELRVAQVLATQQEPKARNALRNIMRVTTKGLESGARDDFLVVDDTTYRLIDDGAGGKSCVPIWRADWVAPPRELLWGKGCSCEGIGTVTGVEAEAWKCPVPKQAVSGPGHRRVTAAKQIFDWYWFTTADNPDERDPLRILSSRPNNNSHLPVLGDAALANLPVVERLSPEDGQVKTLREMASACEVGKPVPPETPNPQLEGVGFAGCREFSPPTWPQTAYSDGALYSIGGDYTSIYIYYDFKERLEVSEIVYQSGDILDTWLDSDTTWQVLWPDSPADPEHPFMCEGGLKNVGIWHPKWPTRDGCTCKAAIGAESPLNPADEPADQDEAADRTVYAMSCYFGGDAFIQSWYSKKGRPHLFYETNAVDLDLIDYDAWKPGQDIKLTALYEERLKSCMTPSKNKVTLGSPFCADCHGGRVGYE